MTKDQALKQISKYLLSGAEMLRVSCPSCQIPLLRAKKNNKIFCGSCKRTFKQNAEDNSLKPDTVVKTKPSTERHQLLSQIELVLLGKLEHISNQLVKATGINNNELETIDMLLNLLVKINALK